jgi:hypothetical protein
MDQGLLRILKRYVNVIYETFKSRPVRKISDFNVLVSFVFTPQDYAVAHSL